VALLQRIVEEWRGEVEARGGRFYVALLPRPKEGLAEPLFAGSRVISLWREFRAYRFEGEPWRFEKDGHWNELGNQLAAIHLYKHLAPDLGASVLSDAEIRRALGLYYAAFDDYWEPSLWVERVALEPERARALRRRYAHLESGAHRAP
jgi:hypothetical protein